MTNKDAMTIRLYLRGIGVTRVVADLPEKLVDPEQTPRADPPSRPTSDP